MELFFAGIWGWFQGRSKATKIVIVTLGSLFLILAIAIPPMAHSIAKRNRLIREQRKTIKGLKYRNEILHLEQKRTKEKIHRMKIQSQIKELMVKDGKVTKEIAKSKGREDAIKKKIKEIKSGKSKVLNSVNNKTLEEQDKRVKQLLKEWT